MAVLPTIKFLTQRGTRVIILSHRGRPPQVKSLKLKVQSYKKFSLKPFAEILSRLLKKPVHFIDFNIGKFGTSDVLRSSTSQILKSIREEVELHKISISLLENLRFFSGEEKNDKDFARLLASLGDIFINDAFAVSHRENASVAAITKFLPSYAGLILEKEIKNLDAVMKNFKKPLVVILGGAKVSDKIGLIKYFFKKADYFLIGGAIANTFFASQIQNYLNSKKIILPVDTTVYQKKILDIGPETIKNYQRIIKKAKTIIWNGPMGMFEDKRFAKGTEEIAAAILKNKKAKIVIGGGETIASLREFKILNLKFKIGQNIFLSTGGGAMLEYLAGKKLPGIEVLK